MNFPIPFPPTNLKVNSQVAPQQPANGRLSDTMSCGAMNLRKWAHTAVPLMATYSTNAEVGCDCRILISTLCSCSSRVGYYALTSTQLCTLWLACSLDKASGHSLTPPQKLLSIPKLHLRLVSLSKKQIVFPLYPVLPSVTLVFIPWILALLFVKPPVKSCWRDNGCAVENYYK